MQILIHPDFLAQHAYHKYFRIISTLYYSCNTCDTRDTWRHLGNRMGSQREQDSCNSRYSYSKKEIIV